MFRIAYAFIERHFRTAYSDIPVDYYVLRLPLVHHGLSSGDIATTDPQEFREILAEQRERGTNIVSHRLPFLTKSIDEVAIFEGTQPKTRVRRIPFAR